MIDFLSRQAIFFSLRLLIPFAEWLRSSILKIYVVFPFKTTLDYFYLRSRTLQYLFAYQFNPAEKNDERLELTAEHLARIAGFKLEEVVVRTHDGFLLNMHHIQPRTEDSSGIDSSSSSSKAHVLVVHALMQCSDTFLLGGSTSLVAALVNAGYDVWLGNCRGNKYSQRHERYAVNDKRYWNFSIDELAMVDLPAMVNAIRERTSPSTSSITAHQCGHSLVLVGFSQGSAVIAAALASMNISTHDITAFIALAPPIKVKGMRHNFIADLVQARSKILLGNTSCLSSTLLWREFLSPKAFSNLNVTAMRYLFGWHNNNISPDRRVQFFQHIFSNTSTKVVNHWFQIIAHNDGILGEYKNKKKCKSKQRHLWSSSRSFWWPSWLIGGNGIHRSQSDDAGNIYDVSCINCPIAVFAGSEDHLIDPMYIHNNNSSCILTHIEEGYEHLDMIWADSAHKKIFPKIVEIVNALV